jgi:single-stranded-DNA-specific exonuclease
VQRRIRQRAANAADKLPADLDPVLRRIYLNRGVSEPAQLDLSLSGLLPFHSLKGIGAAVELLAQALAQRWHICVVGDYDADGATATALLLGALGELGATKVSHVVPDRFRLGYGLSPAIVEVAARLKPDLLVTVDNGIASVEGVAAARAAGIRVLITDHHLAGRELPQADAIVNPNQPGCAFPSKALSGVGVAFYVIAALRAHLREQAGPALAVDVNLARYLDLVALGTVADLVPLDRNNRILVSHGIARLRAGSARPGVSALLKVAGKQLSQITATDLGFVAAPRLNAAGRLEDMALGIACLTSTDEEIAMQHARRLDALNRERREIQQQMQQEALAAVAEMELSGVDLPVSLCVHREDWHEGVVGLVASRLKERFHRPAIAFAVADDGIHLKGSARSVRGFHIRDALDSVATANPGLISRFGGHAMAAGLTLPREQLTAFIAAFETEASRWLSVDKLDGSIETDGELPPDALTADFADALRVAGPWGQAFPEPLFDGIFEMLDIRALGEKHSRLRLRCRDGKVVEGVAFNRPPDQLPRGSAHVAYRLESDDYFEPARARLVIEYVENA